MGGCPPRSLYAPVLWAGSAVRNELNLIITIDADLPTPQTPPSPPILCVAAWKGPSGASTRRAWDERIAGQWERPRVLTWHHPRASSLKMLGLSLWEGRLPGQKTIENEDKAAIWFLQATNSIVADTITDHYYCLYLPGTATLLCRPVRAYIWYRRYVDRGQCGSSARG